MRPGLRLPEHCRNRREELSSCDVPDLPWRNEFDLQAPLLEPQSLVEAKPALSGWTVRWPLDLPWFEPGMDCQPPLLQTD